MGDSYLWNDVEEEWGMKGKQENCAILPYG